jgi:hypothetical protein
MSVDYHETQAKIKTTVLVNQKPVVRVTLNKSTGETLIKVLSGDRVLETYVVDENRQKSSFA